MTIHTPLTMSKEAFLAWSERRDERYELVEGRPVMMVRVTLSHALVTSNLISALTNRLPQDRYNIVSEAFAVDIGPNLRFPDVLVQPAQTDLKALEAKAPILIAEVLSPGTLHIDFGEKRQEYLGLSTLETYLILSPDEPRAWIWQRAEGSFPAEPEIIEGLHQQLALPALGIDIPFSDIYRGIVRPGGT
jgi:Uma2 family endonuclease